MRRNCYKLLIVTGLSLLAIAAGPVRADFQQVLPPAIVPLQLTNWNQFITIPKFDPTLGTLTLVTVKISANFEASILVENTGPSPSNINAVATVTVTPSPSPPVVWSLGPMAGGLASGALVTANDGTLDFTGTDTASFGTSGTLMVTRSFSNPGDLGHFTAGFIGDNWSVNATGTGFVSVTSDSGNVHSQGQSKAGMQVDVTYHYIPEPTTLAFLTLGLGVMARRRRR